MKPLVLGRLQNGFLGPDHDGTLALIDDDRAPTTTLVRQQINGEGIFPNINVVLLARAFDDGAHDLGTRCVSARVYDSLDAMPTFPAQ